jgi:hypothetical protein
MSPRNARSGDPPPTRKRGEVSRSAGAVPTQREPQTSGGRRGRPSYEEYAKRVCEALRYDLVQLESCTTLAQLPGVQAIRKRQSKSFLPLGASLRATFDQAVADVEAIAEASHNPALRRVAVFRPGGRGAAAESLAGGTRGATPSARPGSPAILRPRLERRDPGVNYVGYLGKYLRISG